MFPFQRQGKWYFGKIQMVNNRQTGQLAALLPELSSWQGAVRNYLWQSWRQLSGSCCSVHTHGFSPAEKEKKKKWLAVTLVSTSCEKCRKFQWEARRSSWCFPDDLQVHHCNYDPEHLCRWVSVWTWAVSSLMPIHLSHPTGCWDSVHGVLLNSCFRDFKTDPFPSNHWVVFWNLSSKHISMVWVSSNLSVSCYTHLTHFPQIKFARAY